MRSSQWFVLGIAFVILMCWFIYLDSFAEMSCGVAGQPPVSYTAQEWVKKGIEPVSRVDLWCINTEILEPFIYLFAILGVACYVNGGLEWWARRKKR